MDRESVNQESDTGERQAVAAPESVELHVTRRAFFRVAGILGLAFGSGLHGAFVSTKARRSLVSPEIVARRIGPALMVGLEIGTSTICVAVGERSRDGRIKLLGVGQTPSVGVRKGEIVDLDAVAKCLRQAMVNAERKSDVLIRSVCVGVAGAHIQGFNHPEVVFSRKEQGLVGAKDLEAMRIRARDVNIPAPNAFLHSLAQRYQVDNRVCVLDPIGLSGRKLKADFHIIHGERTRLQQTIRCVKELQMEVEDLVFTALASAEVVLTQGQKNRGALVIDLGAGTTGYVLYADGAATQSGMLAIGGDHITNDLSMGLRIPMTLAEELTIKEGSVTLVNCLPDETIPLEGVGGCRTKQIKREVLNTIIHMRVRETLETLKQRLTEGSFVNRIGEGVFLTGGCSLLPGVCALAQEIFGTPACLAEVTGAVSGCESDLTNPQYSCAIGLLKFGPSCVPSQNNVGLA